MGEKRERGRERERERELLSKLACNGFASALLTILFRDDPRCKGFSGGAPALALLVTIGCRGFYPSAFACCLYSCRYTGSMGYLGLGIMIGCCIMLLVTLFVSEFTLR